MEYFVEKQSIVRKIWSKGDTILFIFAGAAAEFALNKAVDWLYFTGKLPGDPLERLFSTVTYARQIVFSNESDALNAIDKITSIHRAVEVNRGATIPDWAYRDVLYMLIHYSIASYELMERELLLAEKDEIYNVFFRMGSRMQLINLPSDYTSWLEDRNLHLTKDLQRSNLTKDLFDQYKRHLGWFRYSILLEGQKLVIPEIVREQLLFSKPTYIKLFINYYKYSRLLGLDKLIRSIILPGEYKKQIEDLDVPYSPV